MLERRIKSIWAKRKAVSPVIAAILLIALTVTAVAIVIFVVMPMLRGKGELVLMSYEFEDTNDNNFADKLIMELSNIGTAEAIVSEIDFKRGSTSVNWIIEGGEAISILSATEETVTFLANSDEDEIGYNDIVSIGLPNCNQQIQKRITPEFSPFVLLYEEDCESSISSDWVQFLFTTTSGGHPHGTGAGITSAWQLVNDPASSETDKCWQCTTNDCQFITLQTENRDFWDVNISYYLYTKDDDGNGIIFRYDDAGAYPRFYIIWYTENHPGPNNPGTSHNEGHLFNWHNDPEDRLEEGEITLHYVEGYDAGGGVIGFEWYKLDFASSGAWTRNDDQWYEWRLIAEGSHICLYIDGEETPTLEAYDSRIEHGYVGLTSFANQNSYYDDIYVWQTET
ncbi:MAG: hypothetical protein GF308_12900 [Candidatus Heimdallarchaeota archaeon]|nr:hypothetical protein [Candidatus Heimdallarchaeota archaeon]